MSEYRSFITDFPDRCAQLLGELSVPAARMEREVTLLLAVASAGLAVPYERLRADGHWPHPSGDRDRFGSAVEVFDALMERPFVGSVIWPDYRVRTWTKGKIRDVRTGGPDSWRELRSALEIQPDVKVKTVLTILRNSLTHGNVWTQGRQIRRLVFLSRHSGDSYRFLAVSPEDFRSALASYLVFLARLPLSDLPIGSADEVA